MQIMKRLSRVFLLGILAGGAIGLGGLAFLACCSASASVGKIIGSLAFSVGLLTVCGGGLFLYTGKIGYVFEEDGPKPLDLLSGYLGNLVGAIGLGYVCYAIPSFRDGDIGQKAYALTISRNILDSTNGEAWYQSLLLSILCGILVYLAVDMFKRKQGLVGTLILMLGVFTFVVSGCEHCIANMFYYAFGHNWTGGLVLNLLITTLGNSVGALLVWSISHLVLNQK